jgi:hypothetical protein
MKWLPAQSNSVIAWRKEGMMGKDMEKDET